MNLKIQTYKLILFLVITINSNWEKEVRHSIFLFIYFGHSLFLFFIFYFIFSSLFKRLLLLTIFFSCFLGRKGGGKSPRLQESKWRGHREAKMLSLLWIGGAFYYYDCNAVSTSIIETPQLLFYHPTSK